MPALGALDHFPEYFLRGRAVLALASTTDRRDRTQRMGVGPTRTMMNDMPASEITPRTFHELAKVRWARIFGGSVCFLLRRIVLGLLSAGVGAFLSAQDFAADLARARDLIAAKDWPTAYELLDELLDDEHPASERQALAEAMRDVAIGMNIARTLDSALRANQWVLDVQRALHEGKDHVDVARSLIETAQCLDLVGHTTDALQHHQMALAMYERLYGSVDHVDRAAAMNFVAMTLESAGRPREALPMFQAALAMRERLLGVTDHRDLAFSLNNLAYCLQQLGRVSEAVPLHDRALAMRKRLEPSGCSEDIAESLNNLAFCLLSVGRTSEALEHFQAAASMSRRLAAGSPDPTLVLILGNIGGCLRLLGREVEALDRHEEALAQAKLLYGGSDHPHVAATLVNRGGCLELLGRHRAALDSYDEATAMYERLSGGADHPGLIGVLNKTAICLRSLGRPGDALPRSEAALAMSRRIFGEADHAMTALSLNEIGVSLKAMGRPADALPCLEGAKAMQTRLAGTRDHAEVASGESNLASCLAALGRYGDALPHYEAAVEIWQRLHAMRDHPLVAQAIANRGTCRAAMGHVEAALVDYQMGLAIVRRIYGSVDHPLLATAMANVALCEITLGHPAEALPGIEAVLAMRQRLYAEQDHPEIVEGLDWMAKCLQQLGRIGEAADHGRRAVAMVERIRATSGVGQVLAQSYFDQLKGSGVFERLQALTAQLGMRAESLHVAERARGRDLLDLLARQDIDELSLGRELATKHQNDGLAVRLSALQQDLETTLAARTHVLLRLARNTDEVASAEREAARSELVTQAAAVGTRLRQLSDERNRLLGQALPVGRVCTAEEIRGVLRSDELLLEYSVSIEGSHVYVLASGRDVEVLPLGVSARSLDELLPQVLQGISRSAIVPRRGKDPEQAMHAGDQVAMSRTLFSGLVPAPLWPRVQAAKRVFVVAHRGLHRLPFEALVVDVRDGNPVYWLDAGPPINYVPSGSVMHWLRTRVRDDKLEADAVHAVIVGDPRLDGQPASAAVATGPGATRSATREGDLGRLLRLPRLAGARAEAEGIARAFESSRGKRTLLLSEHATEPAVRAAAASATHLHFACHGIAEEYANQSLSLLALARSEQGGAGADGLLELQDLLNDWRGCLRACRLVVLSACQTNVGPVFRDEAPMALPMGFLQAGAQAVISSLWAVDDVSTRQLMIDFYTRYLHGEGGVTAAFTMAKKALRQQGAAPFQWAPFLVLGCPDS